MAAIRKIALIHLPFWPAYMPPLGLAYIAASLKQLAYDVDVFDLNAEYRKELGAKGAMLWSAAQISTARRFETYSQFCHPLVGPKLKELVKKLIFSQHDAIGFSVNELNIHSTRIVIQYLRSLCPSLKIFCGGPDVYKDNGLLYHDVSQGLIDALILGEGEELVIEVVKRWESDSKLDHLPGVHSKDADPAKKNLLRSALDPFTLPIPDFSWANWSLYDHQFLPVMMSRGCVASCTFCTEFVTWRSYRNRDYRSVVEEIGVNVKRYGIRSIYFCDSLINGEHESLEKLADLLIETKLNIKWTAFARVDKRLTADLLKKLARSGCEELKFGLESGSNRILKLMNKKNDVETAYRTLRDTWEAGIRAHGLFLISFPGETEEDFFLTQKLIYNNRKYLSQVSIGYGLELPPVAPMTLRPKRYDIKLNPDGTPYLDKQGNWFSRDGSFGPTEQQQRVKRMMVFLDSFEVKYFPLPTEPITGHRWIHRMEFHLNRMRNLIQWKPSLARSRT